MSGIQLVDVDPTPSNPFLFMFLILYFA